VVAVFLAKSLHINLFRCAEQPPGPLDVLFIAREQAKREARVSGTMLTMPVVVRTHDGTVPVAHLPGLPTPPHPGHRSGRLRDTHIHLRGAPPAGAPGARRSPEL
jgi:hypothetical protein